MEPPDGGCSNPWTRVRQLLQRVCELEGEMQTLIAQKLRLESENEQLTARVEVWVGAHTDGVVLEREAFLELERAREDLVTAHTAALAAQAIAQEELTRALDCSGMLHAEVDGLTEAHREATKQCLEVERSVAELQSAVAQLMLSIKTVDTERGALLVKQRQLHGGQATAGSRIEVAEQASLAIAEREAAAVLERAKQAEAEEAAEAAVAALSVGSDLAERLQKETLETANELQAEREQLWQSLAAEEDALRLAASAASMSEDLRRREMEEMQLNAAHLRDEIAAACQRKAEWHSGFLHANEEHESMAAEVQRWELRASEAHGTVAAEEAGMAAERREWEAQRQKEEALASAERHSAEKERQDWEAERAGLLLQLEDVVRGAELSRKAIQTTLGQLVLEKQEILEQIETSRTNGAR